YGWTNHARSRNIRATIRPGPYSRGSPAGRAPSSLPGGQAVKALMNLKRKPTKAPSRRRATTAAAHTVALGAKPGADEAELLAVRQRLISRLVHQLYLADSDLRRFLQWVFHC